MNGTQEDEKIKIFLGRELICGGENAVIFCVQTLFTFPPPSVFYLWQPSGKPLAAVLKDDGADFLYFREIKEE